MAKLNSKKNGNQNLDNAGLRKKTNQFKAKNQTVNELKVTKVLAKDRKERNIPIDTDFKKEIKTVSEKIVRSLRKKLTEISILMEKQKEEGVELDEQQLNKISRLPDIMSEMESYSK